MGSARSPKGWETTGRETKATCYSHLAIYLARWPKSLARLERQARHLLPSRRGIQLVAPRMQLAASFATTLWPTGSPARAALVADAAVRDAQETGHPQSLWEILALMTAVALWNGISTVRRVMPTGNGRLEPIDRCTPNTTALCSSERRQNGKYDPAMSGRLIMWACTFRFGQAGRGCGRRRCAGGPRVTRLSRNRQDESD